MYSYALSNTFLNMGRYEDEKKKSIHRSSFMEEGESVRRRELLEQNLKLAEQNRKAALEGNQRTEEEQEMVEDEKEEVETSKTDTDIIVKPDGSRVLLVTTEVCGMQTSMSLEISKPTAMQNDISKDEDNFKNREKMRKASAAYESGYMTGIETESGFK